MEIARRDLLGMSGAALGALGTAQRAGAQVAGATTSRTADVKVEKNVTTGKGGDTELHVDIYRPPVGTEKRMALVHFHGGGFVGGNKESLSQRALPITARGYVSVTAQYRLGKGVTCLQLVFTRPNLTPAVSEIANGESLLRNLFEGSRAGLLSAMHSIFLISAAALAVSCVLNLFLGGVPSRKGPTETHPPHKIRSGHRSRFLVKRRGIA